MREKINFSTIRNPEEVISESTSYCRESGRLTWIVLDWLIRNIDKVNENKLIEYTEKLGNFSVLGVLCDLAYVRNPNPKFKRILKYCKPYDKQEIFFNRDAKSPLASKLSKENPIDTFIRWNFICNEVRYLH